MSECIHLARSLGNINCALITNAGRQTALNPQIFRKNSIWGGGRGGKQNKDIFKTENGQVV
jgi:seryl-tRNA synthetase